MTSSVLFASCTDEHPREVIKLLLGEISEGQELEPGITAHPWHINTKYYEVDVNLCSLNGKSLGSQENAKLVQAVVLYFDSDDCCGLEEANKWLPYLKEYEVEIQILLCNQCKEECENGTTKLAAQEWCIKEGFELVELNPKLDEEWENEQDFIETTGIKRVKQALEAHVWPNLVLKERKEPTSMSALLHGGVCKSSASEHDNVINSSHSTSDSAHSEILENLFDEESGANIGFSELFSQLVSMKERASSLPNEKRKEFAEQVVRAYWKAIGGDQQELFDS